MHSHDAKGVQVRLVVHFRLWVELNSGSREIVRLWQLSYP
jgi:hypothetical protein